MDDRKLLERLRGLVLDASLVLAEQDHPLGIVLSWVAAMMFDIEPQVLDGIIDDCVELDKPSDNQSIENYRDAAEVYRKDRDRLKIERDRFAKALDGIADELGMSWDFDNVMMLVTDVSETRQGLSEMGDLLSTVKDERDKLIVDLIDDEDEIKRLRERIEELTPSSWCARRRDGKSCDPGCGCPVTTDRELCNVAVGAEYCDVDGCTAHTRRTKPRVAGGPISTKDAKPFVDIAALSKGFANSRSDDDD